MERGTWAAHGTGGASLNLPAGLLCAPLPVPSPLCARGQGAGLPAEGLQDTPTARPTVPVRTNQESGSLHHSKRASRLPGGAESQPQVFKVKIGFSLPFHR